jgi:hypothetical protein
VGRGLRRRIKDELNLRIGWHVLFEARNKIRLGPRALLVNRRLENAEVRRLRAATARPPALVATVIPTHRRPEQLRAAVASALAQTVTDQIVIVVDDGAGLPDLPADPRLVAVSLSRNIGITGIVRNIGIRLTDSRFVAFVDDDNLWEPDHLEKALAALQSPPHPHAVYTALHRVYPDGGTMDRLSVPFDRRLATRKAFLDTNALVATRNRALVFSRIRRPPEVLPREDWELVYRYSRKHTVLHVPHATVRYLVNPGSFFTEWDEESGGTEMQEAGR